MSRGETVVLKNEKKMRTVKIVLLTVFMFSIIPTVGSTSGPTLLDSVLQEVIETEEVEKIEEEEDEKEIDEHIWLSVKNASKLCKSIADVLGKKDPDNKDTYSKNADAYIAKLNELDGQYEQVCSSAKNDTLIFADRFPFRYMTDDYNLKYYAAFSGCSAESEASFQTLVFLANKLDELKLNKLIIIDGSDKKIPFKPLLECPKDRHLGLG